MTGSANGGTGTPASSTLLGDTGGTPATPPAAGGAGEGSNPWPKEDWRHGLPEALRGDPSIKMFNDVSTLTKSYIDTKKMVGTDKVPLPNKHWTEDDYQQFYDKLGRPPLEKYEVNLPKDSKFVSPEWVKEMAPLAHKAGIVPKQLEPILSFYEQKMSKVQEEHLGRQKAEQEKAMGDLKNKWGQAYDKKLSYARTVVKELATPEIMAHLVKTGAVDDPVLAEFLAGIGEKFYSEDTVAGGGGSGPMAPQEALAKYTSIIGDPNHPYHKLDHPSHKNAVDEVQKLFQMAYYEGKGA